MTASAKKTPAQQMELFDQLLDQSLEMSLDQSADASLNVLTKAMNVFRQFFQVDERSTDSQILKARCLGRLIDAFGTLGQVSQARIMLIELARLPMLPEVKLEATRAALTLATDYAAVGDLMEAKSLFNSVGRAGQDPLVALEKGRAILSLAAGQAKKVSLEVARATFQTLDLTPELTEPLQPFLLNYVTAWISALGPRASKKELTEAQELVEKLATGPTPENPDTRFLQFRARLALAEKLAENCRLNLARALFESDSPNDEITSALKARTGAFLVSRHLELGQISQGVELYEKMTDLGDSPDVLQSQVKAASSLLDYYLETTQEEKALKLYQEIGLWPRPELVAPARAWFALGLIKRFSQKNRLPEALKIYHELANHLGSPQFPLESDPKKESAPATNQLLVALGSLAVHYLQGALDNNRLDEARTFYRNMSSLGSSRVAQEAQAMAASLLIANHAAKERMDEAISVFRTIPQAGLSEAIHEARRLASNILTHCYALIISGPRKEKPPRHNRRLAATWKGTILAWLDEQLKDFKKAQGTSSLPSLWK
jgi:hypothetical protein